MHSAEPETIKICPDCNSTVTVVDGPVKVIDGPVAVQKNFYSFGLWTEARMQFAWRLRWLWRHLQYRHALLAELGTFGIF